MRRFSAFARYWRQPAFLVAVWRTYSTQSSSDGFCPPCRAPSARRGQARRTRERMQARRLARATHRRWSSTGRPQDITAEYLRQQTRRGWPRAVSLARAKLTRRQPERRMARPESCRGRREALRARAATAWIPNFATTTIITSSSPATSAR